MTERYPDKEPRAEFNIDLNGAYLTELIGPNGQPILFPRTDIAGKSRGGSHVCLPNFGPDSSGELAQHGFGRTSAWEQLADDTSEDGIRVVELKLSPTTVPDEYRELDARLRYWCGPDHFSMRLTALNGGQSPMRMAPGFHPYFMADQPLAFNGQAIDLSAYSEAQFTEGNQQILEVGDQRLVLSSQTLNTWALWTDQLGEYFCVEPTLAGPSFDQLPAESELIAPGRMKSYDFSIAWEYTTPMGRQTSGSSGRM